MVVVAAAAEDDAENIDVAVVDLDLDSTNKEVVAFRYCQSESAAAVETFPSGEEERTFEIPKAFHSVVAVQKERVERTKEAFLEEAK